MAKIIDAHWEPHMNILHVQCDCGRVTLIRADRSYLNCKCGRLINLFNMKYKEPEDNKNGK